MTDHQQPHKESEHHTYEANPAPWWLVALWVAYFFFAVSYLTINLLRG